ncbi:hypothetical protein DPMN_165129 [Dreissena polymorpha]|uniref:Uncharacterized protein n=1 Tax=Dreissena polymorpha TaxID=45954 RepID=A0A9D4IUB8_DREPO|nr:hypothetical protein DPMN_165129 [Dreissena polymorpha]
MFFLDEHILMSELSKIQSPKEHFLTIETAVYIYVKHSYFANFKRLFAVCFLHHPLKIVATGCIESFGSSSSSQFHVGPNSAGDHINLK